MLQQASHSVLNVNCTKCCSLQLSISDGLRAKQRSSGSKSHFTHNIDSSIHLWKNGNILRALAVRLTSKGSYIVNTQQLAVTPQDVGLIILWVYDWHSLCLYKLSLSLTFLMAASNRQDAIVGAYGCNHQNLITHLFSHCSQEAPADAVKVMKVLQHNRQRAISTYKLLEYLHGNMSTIRTRL